MPDTLNPDEINALMSALKDGRVAQQPQPGERGAVTPYDLTSQDRIIRGQMPTLDAINEQIAAALGSGLSGRTRLALRVETSPASLFKFVDFGSVLAAPGAICVLGLGISGAHGLIVLEPGLADSLLAAALGDRHPQNAVPPAGERRELTAVEQLVLRRLLQIFTDAMKTAWAPVLPMAPTVMRFEPDPRMAAIAPPTDVVIVSTFQITSGLEGRLSLVIPYSVVEPAKQRLSSPPRMNPSSDQRFARALEEELTHVEVELRGMLGTTTLNFEKLLELEVGDVLVLGNDENAPLTVLVEGCPKLMGTPRVVGGAIALELDHDMTPRAAPVRQQRTHTPYVPQSAA